MSLQPDVADMNQCNQENSSNKSGQKMALCSHHIAHAMLFTVFTEEQIVQTHTQNIKSRIHSGA